MAQAAPTGLRNGRHWILTVPCHGFTPYCPPCVSYIRGQLEEGGESGFRHWQLYVVFREKTSLRGMRRIFGNAHAELTRSEAARAYCWKEETRVEGTQFELGELPVRRNDATDWAAIRATAVAGDLQSVPDQIYIRHYNQLRRIGQDHLRAVGMVRVTTVYWGDTEIGKSRRARHEAGLDYFTKCPDTKWWCGYRGEKHVVIDDYAGAFAIRSFLRWLDRYPVLVESKGGWLPLCATHFWITSNVEPMYWYPTLDGKTLGALLRRLNTIEEITEEWLPPVEEAIPTE